jgi:glycosyltransferase involved in cell wall biosynthesis
LCLYNIPFIFGPVSGGDTIPKQLMKEFSFYSKFKEFIRNLSNRYIQISPLMNLTFLNSKKILVNNAETKKLIPYIYHHKIEEMLAVGINNNGSHKIKLDKDNSVFNICFAGNLIELKGILIVLKTFSSLKVKNHNIKLTIIGSGPYELKFKKAAIKLQIDKDVNWLGKIERDELLSIFNKSDLLLYPSLRDSGATVVLEAMFHSLPAAVLNLGGPSRIVNNTCGIKINLGRKNENEVVLELTRKIIKFIKNPNIQKIKKKESLKRVEKFSWYKKMIDVYGE